MTLRTFGVGVLLTVTASLVALTGCSTETKAPDEVIGVYVETNQSVSPKSGDLTCNGGTLSFYNPCPYSAPYYRCNVYGQCWCSTY